MTHDDLGDELVFLAETAEFRAELRRLARFAPDVKANLLPLVDDEPEEAA